MKDLIKAAFWILGIYGLYYFGFIFLPKSCNDEIKFKDPCIRKDVDGVYFLTVTTKKSDDKISENRELEMYYKFNLKKDECILSGNGTKFKGSLINQINLNKRDTLSEQDRQIDVTGQIYHDTLKLDISFTIERPKDGKLHVVCPYESKKISVLRGIFTEDKFNSTGTAKLKNIENQ